MQGRAEANEADGMRIEAVTTAFEPTIAWLGLLLSARSRLERHE
jgi:hypothetical protein